MRIVIAGGHGKIALRLERILADRGAAPVALIRNPDHIDDVRTAGAEAVVLDLETATATEVTERLMNADAVVFAAGAGPGSGPDRKWSVDRDAAVLLADAASLAGVRRYVMVSAIGVDDGPAEGSDPTWAAYVDAKRQADEDLRSRGEVIDWTVLRPGRLTDEEGTGRVLLAAQAERGSVPRDDVAAVIAEVLLGDGAAGTVGRSLDLVAGDTPVAEAVSAAAAG
ncbi:NAD(P)H-binding protein [Nocardiopsis coralliicola]